MSARTAIPGDAATCQTGGGTMLKCPTGPGPRCRRGRRPPRRPRRTASRPHSISGATQPFVALSEHPQGGEAHVTNRGSASGWRASRPTTWTARPKWCAAGPRSPNGPARCGPSPATTTSPRWPGCAAATWTPQPRRRPRLTASREPPGRGRHHPELEAGDGRPAHRLPRPPRALPQLKINCGSYTEKLTRSCWDVATPAARPSRSAYTRRVRAATCQTMCCVMVAGSR